MRRLYWFIVISVFMACYFLAPSCRAQFRTGVSGPEVDSTIRSYIIQGIPGNFQHGYVLKGNIAGGDSSFVFAEDAGGVEVDTTIRGIPIQDTTGNIADNYVNVWNPVAGRMDWEAQAGAGGGESNEIAAIGETATGADSLTAGKSGLDLRVKSLIAGDSLVATATDSTLTLDVSGFSNYLPLAGGTMSGDISMGVNNVTSVAVLAGGVGTPLDISALTSQPVYIRTVGGDTVKFLSGVITKGVWQGTIIDMDYLDTAEIRDSIESIVAAGYLALAGGTMTGDIDMDSGLILEPSVIDMTEYSFIEEVDQAAFRTYIEFGQDIMYIGATNASNNRERCWDFGLAEMTALSPATIGQVKINGDVDWEGNVIADAYMANDATIDHADSATHLTDGTVDAADIAANAVEPSHLKAVNAPVDEYVYTYESDGGGQGEWEPMAGGSGLTYLDETDDNDTSVVTAKDPNTTVGFNDDVTLQGNDLTGVNSITTSGSGSGTLTLIGDVSGSIALTVPDATGSAYEFTLPASYGASGQQITGDGAGGWSWGAAGGEPTLSIEESDSEIDDSVAVIDFGAGFDITETPTHEINVTIDLTEDQVNLATEVTGVLPDANVANDCTIDNATMADSAQNVDTTTATAGALQEKIADVAGGAFTGNTETGITATYQDADNTVDLVVAADSTVIATGAVSFSDDLRTFTIAELETQLGGSDNVLLETEIDASSELLALIDDETGSGLVVFGTSPTFTTDITSPLIIGGTGTTSDLSLKTTSGVGTTGADMHFLVGNDGATEAVTILNNGYVGIGTNAPNAPLEVKGIFQGEVGGFPSGLFHVTRGGDAEFANAVITGHNTYNTNTQLWYLGSTSSGNYNIALLNRQDGDIHFHTNDAFRMTIVSAGNVGIGTPSPPEKMSVVGNIATGDTTTGDVDVFHYFSTDGSWVTEYLKWDDGIGEFQLSDDIDITGNIVVSGDLAVTGRVSSGDTLDYTFNLADPDALFATDAEWCIDPRVSDAITITRIDVTLNADPTTELTFSLKFADAFIGFANAVVVDDTATVAGVTTVTGGFGDATVPADKCLYLLIDADPDDAITQASFKVSYTVD